jgi:hypothetical protein
MPNGHDYSKEYGPHKYDDDIHHTSDCKFKCGCWMGPARSGGPAGVDPFGECPGNPKDGELVGGSADQDIVIERRIKRLETSAYTAEERAKELEEINSKKKIQLHRDLKEAEKEIAGLKKTLVEISEKAIAAFTAESD